MKEEFTKIYRDDVWGGSGAGSKPKHNKAYMALLQKLLKEEGVKTVLDLGCGDWQFSQKVDWSGVTYIGYDLVESVIEDNKRAHSKENVSFHCYDGDYSELPEADLLIVKDVLQHWSNDSVIKFMDHLRKYPLVLVTNCIATTGETRNDDDKDGGSRPIDLCKAPFKVDAEELLEYTNRRLPGQPVKFRKHVLLIRN